jgi:microsomal prostaglandin-E synthase 1
MQELASQPAFNIYALCAVVLCLNLLGLWAYSGVVRGKSKRTPNTEDASTVSKGSDLSDEKTPEEARVLRAHMNALANIVPFLALGLVYVITGAPALMAWIFFGGFTVMRVGHSFAYLGGKQPWRTICFALGVLLTFGVMIQIARIAIARMM